MSCLGHLGTEERVKAGILAAHRRIGVMYCGLLPNQWRRSSASSQLAGLLDGGDYWMGLVLHGGGSVVLTAGTRTGDATV